MQFTTLIVLLLLALVKVDAKGYPCKKYVITKEGDQCNHICGYDEKKAYYLRFKDLYLINPSLDCDNLEPETKICVEADEYEEPDFKTYKIKSRDTCESISKRLKTTSLTLERVNPNIIVCDRIKNQTGNVIVYQEDGDYEPVYTDESELVTIDGN